MVAHGDDEAGPLDRGRQPGRPGRIAGRQRLLGQERDAGLRPAARRSPPPGTAARPRRRRPASPWPASCRRRRSASRPSGSSTASPVSAVRETTPTSLVRPSRSSASRCWRLIQPPPTRPSRTAATSALGTEDAGQQERHGLLELVVAAGLRRLVRAPALERRAVAEAVALEVVVGDLGDAFRAQRLPRQVLAAVPARGGARQALAGGVGVAGRRPIRPTRATGGPRARSRAAAPAPRPARPACPR